MKTVHIELGAYYDSVHLMHVSTEVEALDGVTRALVAMATESNRALAASLGFDVPSGVEADDMLVAIDHDDTLDSQHLIDAARTIMQTRTGSRDHDYRPHTVERALDELPDAHLVVVSVAGTYAAREVEKAINRGRHVMVFSDNVSPDDEVQLKMRAAQKGLLVMGPDCGTAIVNGVPLCFANVVRRGTVGIVAASGTGLQEVASRVHNLGGGVSQAIGTGGRDLKLPAAGGITTRMGVRALDADEATSVIVVVSKPPHPEVAEALLESLATATKPVVLHFVGGIPDHFTIPRGVTVAHTLAETAEYALDGNRGEPPPTGEQSRLEKEGGREPLKRARKAAQTIVGNRRYLRGLFCGGTLADELIAIAGARLGTIASVGGSVWGRALADPRVSEAHTVVDLGEDVFTEGRPHPMIDPTVRLERLAREATDSETAVIVMDFVLGTGSHPDPVGITIPAIEAARAEAGDRGPVWIATVVGTDDDPQDRSVSERALERAGVIVADSNAEAAELACVVLGAAEVSAPMVRGAPHTGDDSEAEATSSAERAPALARPLFAHDPAFVNVGVAEFAAAMRSAGARVVDVDWRPPARGNARMADLLKRLGR